MISKEERKKLSEDVLMYRAIHNLTQTEFAEKCNLSRDIIVKIEKGAKNIRQTTYLKVKNAIKEEG